MAEKKKDHKEIVRVAIVGNVDDGKSTLLGRLLYDSKVLQDDILHSVKESSSRKGLNYLDLSLVSDGLKDERAQGITIDVAYRYFSTPKRKYIIADNPGHSQFTRNMITGASTAHVVIVLIDATKGLQEQTFRHSYLASMLGVQHLLVCVNKMDDVQYDDQVFENIRQQFETYVKPLDFEDVSYIPISALHGDNVVTNSSSISWYTGQNLLQALENLQVSSGKNLHDARMPIQTVLNNGGDRPFLAAGQVAGGEFKVGDSVMILPSENRSKITEIHGTMGRLNNACTSMSISLALEDSIEFKRGDMIVGMDSIPSVSKRLIVNFCWLDNEPLSNSKYVVLLNGSKTNCRIEKIVFKLDSTTLEEISNPEKIEVNDIFQAVIVCDDDVVFDTYQNNRLTGSLLLVDALTNDTVAGGMILNESE